MNYETIVKIYDEVDKFIIDEQKHSSRSDVDTMTRLTHEARAAGASIALSMMMREMIGHYETTAKERADRFIARLKNV